MNQIEGRKQLFEGKAKIAYEADSPDEILFYFKDSLTAFDGEKKSSMAGKGRINSVIAENLMKGLEDGGVKTSFVKLIEPGLMLAKRVEIVALEVVCRNIATGSIVRRLPMEDRTTLDPPIVEFFLKNDEYHDPLLNEDHAVALGVSTKEEMAKLRELALKANDIMKSYLSEKNVLLADFKLEFGRRDGELLVSDEITCDSCRFLDPKTLENMDKEIFRQDLGDLMSGYKEALRRIVGIEAEEILKD